MDGLSTVVRARRERARRGERGAVAVEFALVMPIFLSLVFGIIEYGMWFNDANNGRQGAREAARMAVVQNYSGTTCTPDSSPAEKNACLVEIVKHEVAAVTGPTYVRIVAPATWARNAPLIVCAVVHDAGLTGFVPLPDDGLIKVKTRMSIEVADSIGPSTGTSAGAPTDIEWDTWCN